MEAKQKAIKDHYIKAFIDSGMSEEEAELYDGMCENIDPMGYISIYKTYGNWKVENKDVWDMLELNTIYFRPKSLNGIESNRGWNKIEDGLPEETERYWVIRDGIVDVGNYSKRYDKWICSGQYYFATKEDLKISHWQPITKPNLPLY